MSVLSFHAVSPGRAPLTLHVLASLRRGRGPMMLCAIAAVLCAVCLAGI